MADKLYYVHFSGENLGPVSAKLMQKLIQLGRLQGTDYGAASGSDSWERLCDMGEFASLFATEPRSGVPAESKATDAPAPKAAAPAPKPVAKAEAAPQPKAQPAPAPEPVKAKPVEAPKPLQGVVTIGKKMFKIVEVRQAGLLIEASGDLEEGTEVAMQISGTSFPKPFEMKAILLGKEDHKGASVYTTEFVRPNPAHKRTLAPYLSDDEKE